MHPTGMKSAKTQPNPTASSFTDAYLTSMTTSSMSSRIHTVHKLVSTKIDGIPSDKVHLNRLKRVENVCVFPQHNEIKILQKDIWKTLNCLDITK